jgi:hypothetical protein
MDSPSAVQTTLEVQENLMSNYSSEEAITRSHRWHAVECNNLAWDLAGQPSRTDLQNEEMLNAAHAAHVAGEADLHRQYYVKAKELGEAIADAQDKKIFFKTFDLVPGIE